MSEYDLKPEDTPAPLPPPAVLNYRPPRAYEPSRRREASTVGPFVIGFFGALILCGGSFFALGATYEAPRWLRVSIFCGVLVALVSLMTAPWRLGARFGLYGMGRGVAIGLVLGMMALGPCAGCYFLMLFEQ